jgi:transposase
VIRNAPHQQQTEPVRHLGVDDWAWRKYQTYGTIFVDLDRHKVVDLLPDRAAESVAAWLAKHQTVETVARDRSGLYADGTTIGAPQALQVADRFHLILNLSAANRACAEGTQPGIDTTCCDGANRIGAAFTNLSE